jgi:hypothetical protein
MTERMLEPRDQRASLQTSAQVRPPTKLVLHPSSDGEIPESGRSWSRSLMKDGFALAALLASSVALHLSLPGPVPSGADGGSWLTLAYERLGHGVMAADVTYLPVFPGLLALLLLVSQPLVGLVTAALLAKASVVAASYWILRSAGRSAAVAGTILIGAAGWQLETYAWGGYPQLLATGLALLASYSAVTYLRSGSRRQLVLLLIGSLGVVTTHKLVGGLLPVALGVAIFHTIWLIGRTPVIWARTRRAVAAVAAPVLLYVLHSLVDLGKGFQPVLNPLGHEEGFLLGWTVREAGIPWAIVILGGAAATLFRRWPHGLAGAVSIGIGWVTAGTGFFLVAGEQRALALTQLGTVLLAVALFARSRESLTRVGRPWDRFGRAFLSVAGISLLGSISVSGIDYYRTATDWYRVVDRSELEVLDRLRAESNPGDVVVASRGRNGNPLGWWVEGYALRPTYSGLDVRFEAFPVKRQQTEIANRIFSNQLTENAMYLLLRQIDAQYLVIDLRGPDGHWMSGAPPEFLEVVVRSPSLTVLRVDQRP